MKDVIIILMFWIFIIFIHEWGHYLAYVLMKHKRPTFSFEGLSPCVCTDEEFDNLTIWERKRVLISGIVLGAVFVFALMKYVSTLEYLHFYFRMFLIFLFWGFYLIGSESDIKYLWGENDRT